LKKKVRVCRNLIFVKKYDVILIYKDYIFI